MRYKIAAASALIIFVVFPAFAQAQSSGTLFLSPGTGVYKANSNFAVRVMLSTGGLAINAAEGEINFNSSELRVVSLSQAGSIFNLWTTEPEFSNGQGTISFGGGNPKGYTGNAGTIFTITFRALRESTADVNFDSGVILAADGKGTNIIGTMRGGVYTITSEATLPEPEYVAPDNTPAAPNITSSTHPDGDKWYPLNDVEFSWEVPSDVTNVRLTADESRSTIPAVFYDSPIKGKTLEDFDEGAWYLHAQFKNSHGWGKVAHFPFNIDTGKPESFRITRIEETDPTDPRIAFLFEAVDKVSGVEDYEVQIDGGEVIAWKDDGTHIYRPDSVSAGEHTMIVKALDKAGNFLIDTIQFSVASLGAPVFTEYPEVLSSGSILVIKGLSQPDSTVTIHLKRRGDEERTFNVSANEKGEFTFIMDERPRDGVYKVWAVSTDPRGAISAPSEEISIAVRPAGFIKIGSLAISYLSILIPLISLLILLILILLFGRRKIQEYRAKVRREVTEAEAVLHESFTQLHFEVQKHLEKLESAKRKRKLTNEEEKMLNDLNNKLNEAEKIVSKEIRDIKRVR